MLKGNEVILNGNGCTLGKTVVIDSPNKLGNCFLKAPGKGLFSVDTIKGQKPLTVNFNVDTEKAPVAHFYHWYLGNGDILRTSGPNLAYTYQNAGTFTARLKIQESEANPNKLKDAGSINIEVFDIQNLAPISKLNCSTNNMLIQCEGLGSYDPEGAPLTFEFIYKYENGEVFREENFSGFSTFAAVNSGLHSVTLNVRDFSGLSSTSVAYAHATLPPNINPVAKIQCESLKAQTIKCSASNSVDSDGTIIKYDYYINSNLLQSLLNSSEVEFKVLTNDPVTVELIVTDNQGGISSEIINVNVIENLPPTFEYSVSKSSGEVPYDTQINITNIVDDSEISEIKVSFSDGEEYFGEAINKKIEDVGSTIAVISVKDEFGLTTNKSLTLIGEAKPIIGPKVYFKYNSYQDSYLYLHHFIEKGSSEIIEANYIIDEGTSSEYRVAVKDLGVNSITTVNVGSLTDHKITLKVKDENAQVSTYTHNVKLSENWNELKPILQIEAIPTSPKTILLDFSKSFDIETNWLIERYEIDFGNGHTQTIEGKQYALYQYPEVGTYLIKVKAISEREVDGDFVTVEKTIQVHIGNENHSVINPKANFTYKIFEVAKHVSFNIDGSVTSNGEIISYVWDFGDGEIGYGERIAHFYEPGIYDVKLTITDSFGLKSSQVQRINITESGSDLLTFIDCFHRLDALAECEVMALDKYKEINYLKINWGDGTEKFVTGPASEPYQSYRVGHMYKNSGTYDVNYYIGTTRGVSRIETATIDVVVANNISTNLQCLVNEMLVTCNALMPYPTDLATLRYEFDFGDGTVVTNNEGLASHAYTDAGNYQINLKVIDENNRVGLAQSTLSIKESNLNNLNISLQCQIRELLTTCNSFVSNSNLANEFFYEYDFGDGTIVTNSDGLIIHTYEESGLFEIKLKVSDNNGRTGVAKSAVMALKPIGNQAPIANFFCEEYGPLTIRCKDTGSYDPDGLIIEKKLTFPDNTSVTLTEEFTLKYFEKAGNYILTYNLVDNSGLRTIVTSEHTVKANNYPLISFFCSSNSPQKLECVSNSYDQDLNDEIVSYEWKIFRDGELVLEKAGLFLPNLSESLNFDGSILVDLTVTDKFGGKSSRQQEYVVKKNTPPSLSLSCYIENKSEVICNANALDSDGKIVEYLWKIEDENFFNSSLIRFKFTDGGKKIIFLKVKDDLGLQVEGETSVTVLLPEIFINCNAEKYKINCIYDFNNFEGISLTETFLQYEEEHRTSDKESSYEFLDSGKKNISVYLFNGTDVVASKRIIMSINSNYMPPEPIFTEVYRNDRVISLDASQSLIQGRLVDKYIWKIDEKLFESTHSIFEYDFLTDGTHTVELTVVDNVGARKSLVREIYVELMPVGEPNFNEMNSTIKGIDSNGNGLRDDVERFIIGMSGDDQVLRTMLRALALSHESDLVSGISPQVLRENIMFRMKVEECIKDKFEEGRLIEADSLVTMLNSAYSNTKERSLNKNSILESAGPMIIEGSMSELAKGTFCGSF